MTSHAVRDLAARLPPSVETRALQTDIRFVEFFGLPGVGKTTASSLLANGLRRCGPLVGDVRMAWGTRTFIGRQIYRVGIVAPRIKDREFRSLLMRIARFVLESGQSSIADAVRVIWNMWVLVAFVQSERPRQNTIVIMDQGLLQGFWSIFLKSKRRATSEKWVDILSDIGVDDMLFVHLRAETGVARDRLLKRGDQSSRMQRASPGRDLDLWSAADRTCRELTADLEKEMGTEDHVGVLASVDVERLASPEDVAERVLEAVLLACLERHRPCDSADR
ncbi:AAA family ATPase [Mesorhizobium captivum]|uniref:AAA family ATPase n=1 Tax=Mesorhizobium captivum TaxID=3072319 RepID=UPI002A24D96F|nr:AAA family ATPase [Mesorhizobium sp. VK23E]MDX8513103.1 AAA family ATPase [Mesorhizobium sp. VK23E]